MIEGFVSDFVYSSLISSIGILLIMVLRKSLLLKYTKRFIYYIWLVIIIKLLIPFKIPLYIPSKIYNIGAAIINAMGLNKTESKVSLYHGNTLTIISNHHSSSSIKIVVYIWLIGVILLTIYYLYTYSKFIANIKYFAYDVNNAEILRTYTKLKCKLKISNKIDLKFYEDISSPFGMGFLNPCIVIPNISYNSIEIELILKHELIHFKNHDLLYKYILVVIKILHWFNPLVYMMCSLINSDCEFACDELLLKNSGVEERKLYAITLVNSIRFNKKDIYINGIFTSFNMYKNKKMLKRRLENMLNLNVKKTGVLIGSVSAVIIVSSLLSINVFAQKSIDKVAQTPNKIEITNTNKVTQAVNGIKETKPRVYISYKDSKLIYQYISTDDLNKFTTDKK